MCTNYSASMLPINRKLNISTKKFVD